VLHVGAGERAHLTPYEAIGVYHDRHVRTAGGWRIVHRHFDVQVSIGDINTLIAQSPGSAPAARPASPGATAAAGPPRR
jgi:hypothetical protein